jgi:hypothetical protein
MPGFRVVLGMVAMIAVMGSWSALAQNQQADNMQIMMEKVKADKKHVVAQNMGLTETEAKGFWPIYDAYQNDLAGINQRLIGLIETYAAAYNANTLTDAQAQSLLANLVAIEESEVTLQKTYIPKLSKVLPGKKVARYIQIENKIRAGVKYQLANGIPLAQ